MKKLLPVLMILGGLALGIYGYTEFEDSGASLSVGDVEISASDSGSRTQAYVLMGVGALGLVVGIGMLAKSNA